MDVKREALEAIGQRVAAYGDDALERVERPSTEARLAGVHARQVAARRPRHRPALVAAAAALALAAAVLLFVGTRPRAITYRVAGADADAGRWVAAETSRVGLDFSDGSRVELAAGARTRVTELGPRGAHVLLERGSLQVSVVPRADNRWVISSGPFAVHVVGTEFEVGWNARAEALDIVMKKGRVRVAGPCIEGEGREIAAPESAHISCVAEAAAASVAASVNEPPAEVLAPRNTSPESPAEAEPSPAGSSSAAATPAEGWRARLAAGELEQAFAEARTAGIGGIVERAQAAELVELGSAARLARAPADAARLYEAARRRFPGSDAAATSAYHLGRMAFDGRAAWSEAGRWFAVYLAERPGGALAPEALGRSMECAAKLGDRPRAREIAARYLAVYPRGAHAPLAKTLVGTD